MSAAVLAAGLVVTGCSPVKMGAAAITGSERITIATLDTQVTNLSEASKHIPASFQLSAAQQTQQTLTWLIRFKVNEELARQAGITVSDAQADAALATIYAAAKANAEQQGIPNPSLDLILAFNGIPPNLAHEVGRYQAINDEFAKQVNGGQQPTSTAAQTATSAKLTKAQCQAAKALNIQVNPQFGQLNYNQLSIVPAPGTVFRPGGPAKAASQAGLTPAC